MGRPIKKIFIGERGAGSAGGEGVDSVTLAGTNNSTGYTAADALTIAAPDIPDGIQSVGEVTVYADGALLEGVTTLTSPTGTEVDEVATYTLVSQKSTTGTGTGAVFTIDKAGGQIDYSDLTITITTIGSGYVATDDIVIDGADLGGTTVTNDLTITVSSFVTNGTIATAVLTVAGSGYTSIPTVTAPTGTVGTLTLTGVLTTDGAVVIASTAFISGGSNLVADIEAQKGTKTYRVTTTDGTEECTLVAATPSAGGEMAIIATDSAAGTYWVTKLMNRTVIVTQNTGTEFADGAKVKWGDTAILNNTVKITS